VAGVAAAFVLILLIAAAFVLINLVVDVAYALLDPRIRIG